MITDVHPRVFRPEVDFGDMNTNLATHTALIFSAAPNY